MLAHFLIALDGMYIVAGVAHANAVALALPQMVPPQ
jgi:hypothetical protein